MNIYITLDYELFSGEIPGTVENCIIRPMNELCRVADKYNVKYVIFVDAAWILCMYRYRDKSEFVSKEYNAVIQNIKYLVQSGHDIQLHFHPQWIYSKWNSKMNKWEMDTEHYMMTTIDKSLVFKSFMESHKLLEEIVGSKIYAYRGCGYVVEEFDGYLNLFDDNDIIIDSSVLRYAEKTSKNHFYDYRNIPDKQIYRFDNSIKQESINGKRIELSISTVCYSFIEYVTKLISIQKKYKPTLIYKDGVALQTDKQSRLTSIINRFSCHLIPSTIDGPNSALLLMNYNHYRKKNETSFVIIGHPKNATNLSINNFEDFLAKTISSNSFLTTRELLNF